MIVNGKDIAKQILDDLKKEIEALPRPPRLTAFTCNPNFETKKFLSVKERVAEGIGVQLTIVELPSDAKTEDCVDAIEREALNTDGIVVQLPFPEHVDKDRLIAAIPSSHDVDALTLLEDEEILPPVVGALKEIIERYGTLVSGKRAVVVGKGRLVGLPAARWLSRAGAEVTAIMEAGGTFDELKDADIVVLGAGSPGLLKPEMIKEGVVVLDAGTSEEGGKLRGDADQSCAQKASLFTPVPGGVGPITVAILFRNLVRLFKRQST